MPHTELFPFLRLFDGRYLDPRTHVWWVEALFWILAFFLAALLAIPLVKRGKIFARMEAAWRHASRRRVVSMLAPGLLVIVLRLALLPLIPVPSPEIHDEFSYLLGAETFAAGRLTNPTPQGWQHFETFHVNMRPSYHSMYPPAQFVFPALGVLLANSAWLGVLLGVAVMCSTITWMLQGWAPAHWALLGGLWEALRFGIFSYWVNSYWGGAMAATAGALVLGAVPRILRSCRQTRLRSLAGGRPTGRTARVKDGVLLALGLVLLANSRPVEGLLFSLPLLVYLVVGIVRCDESLRGKLLLRIALPAGLLLLAGAAWMLYYNYRTVGNPWAMPYMVNHAEYHLTKPFLGQGRNPVPVYRHDSMRRFYFMHELPNYLDSQIFWGVREIIQRNAAIVYVFFFCPVGVLMVAGWLRLLRSRAYSMIAVSAIAAAFPSVVGLWPAHGHYAAPATGAFILIGLVGLRVLRVARVRGARFGLALSRAVVLLLAVALLAATAAKIMDPFELDAASTPLRARAARSEDPAANAPLPLRIERERMESQLSNMQGRHLVIVFYGPQDMPSEEWIANEPDPRSAKIIWARDMGTVKNEELIRAYPGRRVWFADRSDPLRELIAGQPTTSSKLD